MENLGNKILNINKKILITLALILMLLFISVMYFTEEYTNPYMHRGVRIEDIDVSNLSKEDALKEVKSVTDEMIKNKVVNFTYEDISVPVPLRDFGYKLNLEDAINKAYSYGRSDNLFYNYLDIIKGYIYKKNFVAKADIDDTKREEVILNIGSKIFKKALDAYPIINEDGSVTIKDSEIGRYMDINEAKDLINLDILHEDKIELPVYKTEPKIYSNYYDGIDKKLGDFETDYSSSIKNRKENIRLAASKFNNMKLNPGDEISFNDVVGEISEKQVLKVQQ